MQSATTLLSRRHHDTRPSLPLFGPDVALAEGRLHEACGPARWTFAAALVGAVQAKRKGPVFWFHIGWQPERMLPDGMADFCQPEGITFGAMSKMDDILWCMEESLRAGCVPLVVADVAEMPSLTQVRRLHLAAEQSGSAFGAAPLALMITPGPEGGAPGVETRWHMAPQHVEGQPRWRLERLRARTAPQAGYDVVHGSTGLSLAPGSSAPRA